MNKTTLPEKIGAIVDELLSDRGYLVRCKELNVVRAWPSIVGDQLAKVTECSRADQGVLFVRVSSAAWRQEISFMKQLLLSKIRMETGCTTITDIVFY
jgi:predicted nucleic acid-binding Zn ribbon protein